MNDATEASKDAMIIEPAASYTCDPVTWDKPMHAPATHTPAIRNINMNDYTIHFLSFLTE